MNQLGVESYGVKLFWHNTAFTADPAIIREILTTDHANYIKGAQVTSAMHSVLGSGVFNTNGDLWRFHRSMSRPFFTRDKLTRIVPTFVRHADKTLDLFDKASLHASVDIQDLASKFTLDAATEFLFGTCVHSLDAALPSPITTPSPSPSSSNVASSKGKSSETILPLSNGTNTLDNISHDHQTGKSFPTAFTSALYTIASRLRSGSLWPLLEITKDSTKQDVIVIRRFVRGIVEKALARRDAKARKEFVFGTGPSDFASSDERTGEDVETLLDHLVTVSDDIELIQDELINILIAGRDTTASSITFATYLLSQHPEVLEKLAKEVSDILGSTSCNEPTLDSLRRMPYLRAVINETLRLFPAIPLNLRDSIHERVWTDSNGQRFYVPPGTSITYSIFHLHRSPNLWGPDANVFRPERFMEQVRGKDLKESKDGERKLFAFLPFNAGPRSCLGQQLAYAELGVFLTRFVQRLSSTSVRSTPPTSSLSSSSSSSSASSIPTPSALSINTNTVSKRILVLDEAAIPPSARPPAIWRQETSSSVPEKSSADVLPLHVAREQGLGRVDPRNVPSSTPTGVSPRRAVERIWPKSHLSMFVEGGVWLTTRVVG